MPGMCTAARNVHRLPRTRTDCPERAQTAWNAHSCQEHAQTAQNAHSCPERAQTGQNAHRLPGRQTCPEAHRCLAGTQTIPKRFTRMAQFPMPSARGGKSLWGLKSELMNLQQRTPRNIQKNKGFKTQPLVFSESGFSSCLELHF